ncbi:MAG: hypothetical protein J6D45_05205 [Clostridia bacterium]|nr:hypothetical protein [Clostridia bacterium]
MKFKLCIDISSGFTLPVTEAVPKIKAVDLTGASPGGTSNPTLTHGQMLLRRKD